MRLPKLEILMAVMVPLVWGILWVLSQTLWWDGITRIAG